MNYFIEMSYKMNYDEKLLAGNGDNYLYKQARIIKRELRRAYFETQSYF